MGNIVTEPTWVHLPAHSKAKLLTRAVVKECTAGHKTKSLGQLVIKRIKLPEQKQTHRQKIDLWLPRGRRMGERGRWTGSVGLVDANYHIENG